MKNKTMKRFMQMIKPYKKTILLITFLAILINIFELIKPVLIQQVLDNYLPKKIFEYNSITIYHIVGFYILIVVIGNLLDLINRLMTNKMGENVIYNLRNKLYEYIEKANIKFHDKTTSGKLFVRITSDTEDIYSLFSDVITTFPRDIITIIIIFVLMIIISIKLSFVNIITVPLLLITTIVFNLLLRKVYEENKKIRTKLNTFLAESIYGIKVIKIFNRNKEKQKECENNTREHLRITKKIGILNAILPGLLGIIQNIGIALIIVTCTNNYFDIDLDVGIIYLFITYFKNIFNPIDRIIENIELVEDGFSSIDKIHNILEHEELLENNTDGVFLKEVKGKIEFKNVWFAYYEEKWILKNVSFIIEPGESVALVGKTGSGKTTITNLINRFYDIQKGEILIDGINIKDINLKSLRQNIGTILQDPFIFSKSIKDNIKMYNNLSDEKVIKSVGMASANEFINGFENGLDEIAEERGNSYSAGQKQLIAFARIFAQNPSIFILDEATANIDTKTEKLIQKSVNEISKNKTSIFIAHRLSTIVNVDKIIVLEYGKIIEQGCHKELLKRNGYYSILYNTYYNSLKD